MLRRIYLSPIGVIISYVLNLFSFIHKPFMVYGYYCKVNKKFQKHTRISSSAVLSNKTKISISNNVWIGHYCLLDGVGGITIGEGVHVASHSCIYTHSSQNAIRLMGTNYIQTPIEKRIGYIIDKVSIGEYSFIGTSCVILPGITIGKGCVIGAGSIVNKNVPDFSIAVGNPAVVVGDTRTLDEKLLSEFKSMHTYYLNNTRQ
ncbi:MAG TPA: acyltransferase [Bacteroidia bacterium]|nr:acyltransferase [Bacteroidia bacterium]